MDDPVTDPVPSSPRRSWDPAALLTLVNGALVGVSSVYVATGSVMITLIASIVAIALTSLTLIFNGSRG